MIVIGIVDRTGIVAGIADELAGGLGGAQVVDFGRPTGLGASSPRADVLLLGPAEVTEAGLRRELAWRRANPASGTIALVGRGGPVSRDLQRRGLEVIREPFTLAKAQRALRQVLDALSLLAREASRWEPAGPDAAGLVEAASAEPVEAVELEPAPVSPSVAEEVDWTDDGEVAGGGGEAEVVSLDQPGYAEAGAGYVPGQTELADDGARVSTVTAVAADAEARGALALLEPSDGPAGLAEAEWDDDDHEDEGADEAEAGSAPARLGHVITVASATGGCGKTFYATNLAAALAEAGHRVVLVDLDLQFGEVAVALRLQHPYSIYDGLYDSKGRPLPEDAFEAQLGELVAHHPLGFDVIVAPKSPELADYVGASDAARVLRAVTPGYDIVIVDTPPSLNEVVLTALDASDVVTVMATPDVPSLKNLRVFLDTLHRLHIPDQHVRLILNKVEKDIGLEVPQVQEAFGQKFIGLIPQSPVVSRAINAGTVAIQLAPQSPVSRRLRESMDQVLPAGLLPLAGAPAEAREKRSRSPRPRRGGLLKAIARFLHIGSPAPKEVTHEAV